MFRNVLNVLIFTLFVMVFTVDIGWSQNETPANVPLQQPTATAVPIVPDVPSQTDPAITPEPRPTRARTTPTAVVDDEDEEQPLYMNMAVYVGGICFLVVFIGLFMIMSSTPTKSKRRRKK